MFVGAGCCLAAELYCDGSLRRDPDYQLGYQQRGERCEGVYIRGVSGQVLQIVSFTGRVEDFDPKSVRSLPLHWAAAGTEPVHVRAVDLQEKLYYRMDTLRPPGAASYEWPTDILAALRLKRSDLGVLAWVSRKIQGEERAVYLPISVGRANPGGTRCELLLLPAQAVKSVFLTIAPVRADGSTGTALVNGQLVRSGYWPAGEPLKITLPELPQGGLYYLEVGAPLSDRGSATAEMWFYHDAGARR